MKNIIKKILIFLLIISCFSVTFAVPNTTMFGDKDPWTSAPNKSLNYEKNLVGSSLPANFIYGNHIPFRRYYGETKSNDHDTDYRSILYTSVGGYSYSVDPDINDDNNYMIRALSNKKTLGFFDIQFNSTYIVGWLLSLFGLASQFSNFDKTTLLDTFIKDATIKDMFQKLFLFDPSTGQLSILLMIFIFLFMIGLVGTFIEFGKNGGGFNIIFKEIAYLLLSLLLFAACLTDLPTKFSNIAIKFETQLSNAILEQTLSTVDPFWTGEAKSDWYKNYMNEYGATAQIVIERELCVLFDVDNLSVLDDSSLPSVSNGKSTKQNYAYLFYTGDSSRNYNSPLIESKEPCNSLVYFIPSKLQNTSSLDAETKDKVFNTILGRRWAATNGICILLIFFMLAFDGIYFFIGICLLLVSLILIIGGLIAFALPMLFLFKKTRDLAKDICSFLFYLFIFNAFLLAYKTIIFILFSIFVKNSLTTLIGIAVFIVIVRFTPKILVTILSTMNKKISYKTTTFNQLNYTLPSISNRGVHQLDMLYTSAGAGIKSGIHNGMSSLKDKKDKKKQDEREQTINDYLINWDANAVDKIRDEELKKEIKDRHNQQVKEEQQRVEQEKKEQEEAQKEERQEKLLQYVESKYNEENKNNNSSQNIERNSTIQNNGASTNATTLEQTTSEIDSSRVDSQVSLISNVSDSSDISQYQKLDPNSDFADSPKKSHEKIKIDFEDTSINNLEVPEDPLDKLVSDSQESEIFDDKPSSDIL